MTHLLWQLWKITQLLAIAQEKFQPYASFLSGVMAASLVRWLVEDNIYQIYLGGTLCIEISIKQQARYTKRREVDKKFFENEHQWYIT